MRFYPLVCPQLLVKGKHDETFSYVEMNPSLYIDDDNNYTVLIRLVNYRKYMDRSFYLGQDKSDSKYYMIKGKFENDDFNEVSGKMLAVTTHMNKHFSYWTGVEDIRFINQDQVLVTYPELSTQCKAIICRGQITDNSLFVEQICEPSNEEKNWMPFDDNKVIYSVYPFVVKDIATDHKLTEISTALKIKGYHGSTNGVKLNNDYLFLIHKYTNYTEHRWLLWQPDTQTVRVSSPFKFMKYSYIEFPCSLVKKDNDYFVSLGVNDDKAYIVKVFANEMQVLLKTLTKMN